MPAWVGVTETVAMPLTNVPATPPTVTLPLTDVSTAPNWSSASTVTENVLPAVTVAGGWLVTMSWSARPKAARSGTSVLAIGVPRPVT